MLKFNNKVMKFGNYWGTGGSVIPPEPPEPPTPVDPYNPLNLPANTVRVRTSDGKAPIKPKGSYTSYSTATLVSGTSDVYDVYKSDTSFARLLKDSTNVIEVLGANTTNVTSMSQMFRGCSSLSTVPLFDTSNVTYMSNMFAECSSLADIPLFNTSKVTDMGYMFWGCSSVQSGALALYQQASSQTNPPSNHSGTFYNCGSNTTTGAAELAQIPSDWKL